MEAKVSTADLVAYRRRFRWAKLSDKIADVAKVTLRTAEKLTVESLGFREDLPCKPIQWGTVSLPYLLWEKLIQGLVPLLREKEITIRAEKFHLYFGTTEIEHANIWVSHMDGVALEVPPGDEPIAVVMFLACCWRAPAIPQLRRLSASHQHDDGWDLDEPVFKQEGVLRSSSHNIEAMVHDNPVRSLLLFPTIRTLHTHDPINQHTPYLQ